MRPNGMFLTALFAFIALAITVWVGRYRAEPPAIVTAASEPVEVGPPISKTGPHPKVEVPETEYNFGAMSVGSEGAHKFTITNVGQADLELMARKEDTTCSCTFGDLKDGKIAPGQSTTVTLNWKIKAMVPTFRHRAIVRTNDPEFKEVNLVVTGNVDEPMKLKPLSPWDAGELSTNQPATVKGAVYSTIADKFEITEIKTEHDLAKVTSAAMTEDELKEYEAKSGYILTVEVPPTMPIGPFSDMVSVKTDLQESPEVSFRVHGLRPGPIEIIGPNFRKPANVVLMGEFPASEGKSSTLSVFVRGIDQDLELVNAEQTFNSVKLELTKDKKLSGNAQRYLLKITVPPGAPQDRMRQKSEKINLIFNHPDAEKLRIFVEFLAV